MGVSLLDWFSCALLCEKTQTRLEEDVRSCQIMLNNVFSILPEQNEEEPHCRAAPPFSIIPSQSA